MENAEQSICFDDMANALANVQLPNLEEYGFIECNQDANEVVKGPMFDEIRPLLELLKDHEDELPEDWM